MSDIKISLKSDFVDYYDHWFDAKYVSDMEFTRMTKSGMNRYEMLKYLEFLGFKVPLYGKTKDLYSLLNDKDKLVVVYLDTESHCGENKLLIPLKNAIDGYSDYLSSEFINIPNCNYGITKRYLQIGSRGFWLRYTSSNDWRSNCGNVDIEYLCENLEQFSHNIKIPLYAIDFIPFNDNLYAIDFNIAPMIKWTGVDDVLKPLDVANQIKRAFIKYGN